MTLASVLAHIVCTGVLPVPGTIHDPTQPLVLGDQANNNYVVISWDPSGHMCKIQSVYQPSGGTLTQSTLTFSNTGQLLINGQTIAQLPEIAAAVTAAQTAAAQATTSASQAATAQTNAEAARNAAAVSQNSAAVSESNAALFASAPPGTPLPGGGDSAAAGAQKANQIAQLSRLLDVSDPITASETFQSGFLNTERQANPAGTAELVVTIPPGIYSSSEKKRAWASYKLRNTTGGSVKFVGQPGGTNLVTPTLVARGRAQARYVSWGTATRRTLTAPVHVPSPIVDGDLLVVFNAQHQGPAQTTNINFSNDGPTLTWNVLQALPANPGSDAWPDFFIARARLPANFNPADFNLICDEGNGVHFQACDWFLIDGVEGSLPVVGLDLNYTKNALTTKTLTAVEAQSLMIAVMVSAAQVSGAAASAPGTTSINLTELVRGVTTGVADAAAPNDNEFKNQAYVIAKGVATATADFTASHTFTSAAYRASMALIKYIPKTVVGGGIVQMNYEGGRQSLTVPMGTAELWFHPDGINVDVKTSKP